MQFLEIFSFKQITFPALSDRSRVRTPTVLQMEAVECGAASLGIILGHFGRFVPLERLRTDCGVSRDGSKANNVLRAARSYGLQSAGYKHELEQLAAVPFPYIVFWNFNHFVVVEGHRRGRYFLNDPATGPRFVTEEEFDLSFTGVVLRFTKTPEFRPGGRPLSVIGSLGRRLQGSTAGVCFLLFATLLLVMPTTVNPAFTKIYIDALLVEGRESWLRPLLGAMLASLMLTGLLTFLQQLALLRLEMRLAIASSTRFFWHLLRLPAEFFAQRYAGELGSRVEVNDRVANLLSGELATNVVNILTIAAYAGVMLSYDAPLTLLCVGVTSVNILCLQYIARRRIDANRRLLQDRGKLSGYTASCLQSIEPIKASGDEHSCFSKWVGLHVHVVNSEQALGVSSQFLSCIPSFLESFAFVCILALGGLRVMDGSLTLGMLVAFQALMASFVQPVGRTVALGGRLQEIRGDLGRLNDILDYPVDELPGADINESSIPISHTPFRGFLEFRDVTFGYSLLDPPILSKFNLRLEPGLHVALVGESGSGKSTVAKLAAGLYKPWSGDILIDDIPIQKIPRPVLQDAMAMVDQDLTLFQGTIRENIALWDGTLREEQVTEAAKAVGLHDFVSALSQGYDTNLLEAGRNLSGGQRQRVDFARALACRPSILILDEATSALDANTELALNDNLRQIGCTALVVAHRVSSIRDCDHIVVMSKGQIIEAGTHGSLLSEGGEYHRLVGRGT